MRLRRHTVAVRYQAHMILPRQQAAAPLLTLRGCFSAAVYVLLIIVAAVSVVCALCILVRLLCYLWHLLFVASRIAACDWPQEEATFCYNIVQCKMITAIDAESSQKSIRATARMAGLIANRLYQTTLHATDALACA